MKNKTIYTIGLSGEQCAMDALALCFKVSKQREKGFTVSRQSESEDVRFHFYTDNKHRNNYTMTLDLQLSKKNEMLTIETSFGTSLKLACNPSSERELRNLLKRGLVNAVQSAQTASSSVSEYGLFHSNTPKVTHHHHHHYHKESKRPFACNVM